MNVNTKLSFFFPQTSRINIKSPVTQRITKFKWWMVPEQQQLE